MEDFLNTMNQIFDNDDNPIIQCSIPCPSSGSSNIEIYGRLDQDSIVYKDILKLSLPENPQFLHMRALGQNYGFYDDRLNPIIRLFMHQNQEPENSFMFVYNMKNGARR